MGYDRWCSSPRSIISDEKQSLHWKHLLFKTDTTGNRNAFLDNPGLIATAFQLHCQQMAKLSLLLELEGVSLINKHKWTMNGLINSSLEFLNVWPCKVQIGRKWTVSRMGCHSRKGCQSTFHIFSLQQWK